jgi:hypothetical protein
MLASLSFTAFKLTRIVVISHFQRVKEVDELLRGNSKAVNQVDLSKQFVGHLQYYSILNIDIFPTHFKYLLFCIQIRDPLQVA